MKSKGNIAPLLLLLLVVLAVIAYVLISQGVIKTPANLPSVPGAKREASISLQTQYQNPFDKDTQYVNPFAKYKNPFDSLK